MRTAHRPRLFLEALESREVPANIVYNGSLFISAPRAALTVTQQGGSGLWLVQDGSSNYGAYHVTGGITITAGNSAANIKVQFAANNSLPGNLTINGGNGADTISVQGAANASLGGNLSIDGGYGNDSIALGNVNGLTVRGNEVLIGDYGTNTLLLGADNATNQLRGNVSIHSMTNTTFGGGDTLLGATTIDMLEAPNSNILVLAPLNVTFDSGAVLQGSLAVTGTGLPTNVQFNNGPTGQVGPTTLNFGNSNANTLNLNTNFFGNVTYNAAANAGTTLTLGGSLDVQSTLPQAGNLTLNMGSGTNVYNLDSGFQVAGAFVLNAAVDNSSQFVPINGTIGGAATVTFGNGGVFLDSFMTVGGPFTFNAGSGDNTLDLFGSYTAVNYNTTTGNNDLFVESSASFMGTLSWNTGNGSNLASLNVGSGQSLDVAFTFSSGGNGSLTPVVEIFGNGGSVVTGSIQDNTAVPGIRFRGSINPATLDVTNLQFNGSTAPTGNPAWNDW